MTEKVLILGGAGMLGHKALQIFKKHLDTYVTVRGNFSDYLRFGLFDKDKAFDNVKASDLKEIKRIIASLKPGIVLNCIGIIKQLKSASDPLISIEINSLFPHRLAEICSNLGIRLIHISSDCVFSGKKGGYSEKDQSDAEDLYGRTKFLGEVAYGNALTLRTSIIGRELNSQNGLVDWFLNQESKIKGYSKAIYTGFTTIALCELMVNIIKNYSELNGLYNVSSEPIDKFSLLCLIKDVYKKNIEIERYEDFACDRSLDSSLFRRATGFFPPQWRKMIEDMHDDPTPYDRWR